MKKKSKPYAYFALFGIIELVSSVSFGKWCPDNEGIPERLTKNGCINSTSFNYSEKSDLLYRSGSCIYKKKVGVECGKVKKTYIQTKIFYFGSDCRGQRLPDQEIIHREYWSINVTDCNSGSTSGD